MTRFPFFATLFLSAGLTLLSCDNEPGVVDSCGDGMVDPGEECDLTTGGQTCASLGHYIVTGTLGCTTDCRFDRGECGGRCGDNVVEPQSDEECDLTNLNGASCVSLGFSGGTLACDATCRFDIGACLNLCGNGIRDTGEACDDGNSGDGDGCSQECGMEPGWSCDGQSPDVCSTSCGDGIAAGAEECDLADFGGSSCLTLGFHGGTLDCTPDCLRVIDACESFGFCGDAIVQEDYEDCDGADLGAGTCQALGYYGGTLACDAECGFNMDACAVVGRCGDGLLQAAHGEVCDGADLGAGTCLTLGYYGGTLACDAACGFDTTGCESSGFCGDATVQAAFEACDGTALGGQTCDGLGYYDGTLACGDLCDFDFSACGGRCGDLAIQPAFGEVCDGTNLDGQNCRTHDHFTGELGCDPACTSFHTDACQDVTAFSVGNFHVCALLEDGQVRCWGDNGSGQIGDGTVSVNRLTPTTVSGLDPVVSVSAGGSHTCAVLGDGTVRCWGNNLWLQLGSGLAGDSSTPLPVQGLSGAAAVSAGIYHTCTRQSDGTVRCWGSGSSGQLGNGGNSDSGVPVTVSGLTSVIALDAGEDFTCALRQDQSLWCWGRNNYGQLGDTTTTPRNVPVAVSLASSVAHFSAGRYHACAVLSDGTGRCWGINQYGQLGNQTMTISATSTPVVVFGLSTAQSIACGAAHTCAGLSDGTASCWGFNNFGQLGDGTSNTRTAPVAVSTLTRVASVGLGYEHGCAQIAGGKRVWCWGRNAVAQLGDGTTVGRFVPVEVHP
ncbi:MAG: hypothetical protein CVU65_13890 [Deltaproteobacteria bacterium HGW-Deltaproteobacteria-22]|jgi:cysteine-rich repeat protein|nr:MAG: hypothetical protein CVU65_13890 [Deltaproteobacteria bacterium HGW-Deltaproteobacteria-22]